MLFSSGFNQTTSAGQDSPSQSSISEKNNNELLDCSLDYSSTPFCQSSQRRKHSYWFSGILTCLLVVVGQSALNASTGINGTPEYLQWLLKNEDLGTNRVTTTQPPEMASLAPVPDRPPLPTFPMQLDSSTPAPSQADTASSKPKGRVVIERIRRHDTYADLMQRQNISKKKVILFAQKAKPIFDLNQQLKTDTPVKLYFNHESHLIGLSYPIDPITTLRIVMDEQQNVTAFLEKPRLPPLPEQNPNAQNHPLPKQSPLNDEIQVNDDRQEDNSILVNDDEENDEQMAETKPRNKSLGGESGLVREVTIRPGDSLGSLFARQRISNLTALQISKTARSQFDLARQLSPGKTLTLTLAPNGHLMSLMYPVDHERTFWVTSKDGKRYQARFEKNPLDVRLESIDGTVRNGRTSLFTAAKHAGLSKNQAIKLSGLFEWDIDFAHDLHPNDHFTILQEGLFYKGKRVRDGDIVAAEFTYRGELFRAVRYIDPNGNIGYFDKDGNNVRKMFIRAPMDYTQISSYFSNNRLHPLLGYTRAHKGVDYAAPQGTPVRVAGDGIIDFIGDKPGYGNFIVVRHSSKYSTAYAHLQSFAHGLHQGARVRQGTVIGRVGTTGLTTGPHLHYEVLVNDQQVNPLSIQLPSSGPVERKYLTDFRIQSNQLLALLKKRKTGDVTHLASAVMPHARTQAR
ncbi:MAG: peptidoglycan DD-metalloendopeptidase family protein [Magnetococcus sp. YQC-5]